MKLVFFIAIILLFAAEFMYKNSSLLCALHFRWVYNNFKFIFNINSHEENIYHYNSHSPLTIETWNAGEANIEPNLTKCNLTKSNLT